MKIMETMRTVEMTSIRVIQVKTQYDRARKTLEYREEYKMLYWSKEEIMGQVS